MLKKIMDNWQFYWTNYSLIAVKIFFTTFWPSRRKACYCFMFPSCSCASESCGYCFSRRLISALSHPRFSISSDPSYSSRSYSSPYYHDSSSKKTNTIPF